MNFLEKKDFIMTNKTNFIYNEDAREMEELKQSSVDLVITSPPYFNLVDYKSSKQIGFAETYQRYLQSLNQVWKRCIDSLKDDGTICINVCSTVEITRKNQNCYYDIKHDIEKYFVNHGFYIEGTIIWDIINSKYIENQVYKFNDIYSNENTLILNNYEYVMIFKKRKGFIKHSKFFSETRLLDYIWHIPWDYSTRPPAFPKELVNKLIEIYSIGKDVILDPFMGQATTAICSFENNRNFITYETNRKTYVQGKKLLQKIGALDNYKEDC